MGWTSYHATHYKNGKVDRKAEIDAMWNNDPNFEVVKSSMVGSTYYGAIKRDATVFGVVFLTSTDMKDYFNFSYKDMDETCGPYQHDCPKGILDLLTPTASELANEWRKNCYAKHMEKKNPNTLNNLPIGTVIEVELPFDTIFYNKGDKVKLTKCKNYQNNRTGWYSARARFTAKLMNSLEYKIIKRGE